jgi:hypothetical protein
MRNDCHKIQTASIERADARDSSGSSRAQSYNPVAMKPELRRIEWKGVTQQLAEAWRLTKPAKGSVRCLFVNHQSGWELRLEHGDELLRSHAFREFDPLVDAVTEWKDKCLGPDGGSRRRSKS